MRTGNDSTPIEYPDAAGYPDGTGFLDEGTTEVADEMTATLVDEVTSAAARDADRPSAESDDEIEVHRVDGDRYAATIDGDEVASVRFAETDDEIDVQSTFVEPEFRGRGLASELIADALDDIRTRGKRLVVHCPVVAAFLRDNPQFADLLEPTRPDA